MKTLKALVAGSALIAASATQASLVTINFNNLNASAAQAAFVASLNGPTVIENFDSLGTAAHYVGTDQNKSWENASSSFVTNVGTFTLNTVGQGSSSWTDATNANNGSLTIESAKTGESGRESLSNYARDLWLDSNDAKSVTWNLGSPLTGSFNSFGFYMSDVNDVGGILTLKFFNGTWGTYVLPAHQSNGNVGYVTVISDSNIVGGTFSFLNNSGSDGWGIDDVTVGNVPEPGALMLMGLGLLGLGAARRRINA